LQPIKNDRPIYLYIDASTIGVGGAVLQYEDDAKSPHICGYISFATTDTQRRWNPYQLEFLALGLCLRQYETIFLQSDLTVFTDNAVVAAIQNYRPLNNRERRLIAYIYQFPMTLRCLPGRKNTIADCLSRIGEDLKKEDLVKFVPSQKLYDEEFILPISELEDKNWTVYSLQDVSYDAADVNPLRRSSRIAERRAKLEQLKSTKDSVTNIQINNDPAPSNPEGSASTPSSIPTSTPTSIQISKPNSETTPKSIPTPNFEAPSPDKTTNEIFDELRKTDPLPDQVNVKETAEEIQNMIDMPVINPEADYLEDEFFQPIYQYLKEDKLTGNKEIDRKTLFLAENYFLENSLLYKLSLPRTQKEQRVRGENFQLCIPNKHKDRLLTEWHNLCGHFSTGRLLPTIISRFYWKNITQDAKNVSKTCEVCQTSKINPKQQKSPLHPLPVPMFSFQVISFDHKTLSRKTTRGNTHILAIICNFSNWTIYKAVCDETAQTTATVIIEEVVANYGLPSVVISDIAPGYTSLLFSTINKILGVKHRFTATQSKRSDGAAERSIRSLNNGLRIFSTDEIDDSQIELILPIIQISLRASVNPETGLSPFEILYARKMPLPSSISTEDSVQNFCSTNSRNYVKWLRTALNSINDGIRRNKIESKLAMKKNYDRRYKTKEADYRVNDTVLL